MHCSVHPPTCSLQSTPHPPWHTPIPRCPTPTHSRHHPYPHGMPLSPAAPCQTAPVLHPSQGAPPRLPYCRLPLSPPFPQNFLFAPPLGPPFPPPSLPLCALPPRPLDASPTRPTLLLRRMNSRQGLPPPSLSSPPFPMPPHPCAPLPPAPTFGASHCTCASSASASVAGGRNLPSRRWKGSE